MSEVLNAEVTSSEEGGLSRRRIVKGAAWSMPVIAAAIAAPAASASGGTTTATSAATLGTGITYVQLTKETLANMNRSGNGPVSFQVVNSGASFNGPVSIGITITPDVAGGADPGVGVQTFPNGTVTAPSMSAAKVFTASYAYSGGLPSQGTVTFPLSFYYTGNRNVPARKFTMVVTFSSTNGPAIPPITAALEIV
ncbi:hypothetical protein [Arthrobacter sp. B10-11]|uniref:hypothetical protein n=1 Tax=Arthrobacter sp. B10-11 TaxID=3081160 RepID=UPI0029557BB0|nr:hypothetical protein [Arthrobacter sp. B10-11]MDV8147011.1 hypothetical protein [Arthrobacter sp. B10-11]